MPQAIYERLNGFDETKDYPRVTLGASQSPVLAEVDVLVCGGGTAGAAAAIAAARQGANTLVVETMPFLGGIATGGGIHYYYHGTDSAMQKELDSRVEGIAGRIASRVEGFHPEAKKRALQEMAEEAGVHFVFRRSIIGVLKDGDKVEGVVLEGPDGREAVRARVVIDSTGDADVAALAGAQFIQGRTRDGMMMAYSVVPANVSGTNGVSFSNYDAGWVDPLDATDVTRAHLAGRRLLWREPFVAAGRTVHIAPLLGLREARLILGDYVLTFEDIIDGKRFADTITPCRSHYDNHSSDNANESEIASVYCDVAGCWQDMIACDVPYRCLLPKGLEGILVACRGISIDHDAQSALRMQRDMMKLGEAAGIAAALASQEGITPRSLDIAKLQQALLAAGVLREEDMPGASEPPAPQDTQTLIEELAGEDRGRALFELYRRGPSSELQAALAHDQPDIRIGAALVLGLHGDTQAREPLLVCLQERYAEPPPGPRSRPRWFSAAVALSHIGGEGVGEALVGLLSSEDGNPDLWLQVLRGLQRLNYKAAVPEILRFLDRIGEDATLWNKVQAMTAIGWKLELAAADTLIALGSPDEGTKIAAKYADDARAPVRRYARAILNREKQT